MKRVDQAMVERGLSESREKAKRLIMAGKVHVNGRVAGNPSEAVRAGDEVSVSEPEPYVSRGGRKLEAALAAFAVPIRGAVALDLGAATGGFTDCLLQAGAERVYAVDVGRGQLAWKLRTDPRVCVMERTNARFLTWEAFPESFEGVDLAVVDCSFISLRHLLPPVVSLLRGSGKIIPLIKPQFEVGKKEADRGRGVIRDPDLHDRVIAELRERVEGEYRLQWSGTIESPILGPAGNKEFLALLEKIEHPD